MLERASSAGVERVVIPGTDVASSRAAVEIAARDWRVFAAVGIHPHEADKTGDKDIAEIRELAINGDKIVAIGEVGLDHYKGFSSREGQLKLFKRVVSLALELDLPLILHNREASADLLAVLEDEGRRALRGVVHCFSGDDVFLEKTLAMGLYISFAGNITYEKAAGLRELAKKVPAEKLLLETDGPYLSPEPERGKRNEPAGVRRLLDLYAGMYNLSREDIARITTHNANQLFRLGLEKENTAAYAIRDSLYVNITYRCTNRCSFCTRMLSDYVKGYNLRLDKEPTTEEMILALGGMEGVKHVVFCGFGEPTLRLGPLKKVAAYAKNKGKEVRLVTNGEGDLIAARPIAAEIKGLVDRVSISLNAPDEKSHDRICHSAFGERAYEAILGFIKGCRDNGIAAEVTCLDLIGQEGVEAVKRKAVELGAEFRLRYTDVVG